MSRPGAGGANGLWRPYSYYYYYYCYTKTPFSASSFFFVTHAWPRNSRGGGWGFWARNVHREGPASADQSVLCARRGCKRGFVYLRECLEGVCACVCVCVCPGVCATGFVATRTTPPRLYVCLFVPPGPVCMSPRLFVCV
jgi:hypothetical protein